MKRDLSVEPSEKSKKIKLRHSDEASESAKTNPNADGGESNQIEDDNKDHRRFHLQSSKSASNLLEANALPKVKELPRIIFPANDFPSSLIPKQGFGPNGGSVLEEKLFCIDDSSFNVKRIDQLVKKHKNASNKRLDSPKPSLRSCKQKSNVIQEDCKVSKKQSQTREPDLRELIRTLCKKQNSKRESLPSSPKTVIKKDVVSRIGKVEASNNDPKPSMESQKMYRSEKNQENELNPERRRGLTEEKKIANDEKEEKIEGKVKEEKTKLYKRADVKMKLEVAIFCRDYHILNNKNPKFNEVRKQFM